MLKHAEEIARRQFKTSLMKVGKHLEARRFVQYFMSAL